MNTATSRTTTITYDDRTVRQFMIASITFGRLRPLHTNAVIFAFVGNMMFAGVYYSTQRLC